MQQALTLGPGTGSPTPNQLKKAAAVCLVSAAHDRKWLKLSGQRLQTLSQTYGV